MKRYLKLLTPVAALVIVAMLGLAPIFAATDVTVNGGFETGDFTGWTEDYTGTIPHFPWSVGPAGSCDTAFLLGTDPIEGTFDACNGFDGDGPSAFTLTQDYTVPADMETIRVEFYYRAQWDYALTLCNQTAPRTVEVWLIDTDTATYLDQLYYWDTGLDCGVFDTGWVHVVASAEVTPGTNVGVMFFNFIPENFTGPGTIEYDAIQVSFDVAAVGYPNEGEILISVGAPVMSYGAAGNYPTGITLPADYDGNGFDTYVITDSATVAGETWYAIWLGGEDYVWVPASQVTVLR